MVFSRFSLTKTPSKFLAVALLGMLGGCGDNAPPYETLPLRDALRAAPEVIATLPEESRRELALRLQEAERVEPETLTFAPETLNLEPLVSAADSVREGSGKDALVLGEILATEGHGLMEIQVVSESDMATGSPIDVQGKATDIAAPFEEAALAGRAGKTLRGFVARTHAKTIVRMTGLPVGAVAWNDKVYVNESWLVALSALEDACVISQVSETSNEDRKNPGTVPLSVDFSPYDLPANLAECSTQVQKTCACANSMSCTHEPTDQTFSNANAECTWANQQSANASALCVLALMSLDNVRECIERASPACTFMPVSNRDNAVSFVTDENCVSILDVCLRDGNPPSTASTSGSKDSCGDCRYCDNKGNDCQECANDCKSFADACEVCVQILALCAGSKDSQKTPTNESPYKFAAIHPVDQCSVRPASGRSPLPAPVGTALWLFAPIAYLLSRPRRRM